MGSGAVGIGLRPVHQEAWKALRPQVDFLEIHPENYRDTGSLAYRVLEQLRQDYAVSLHGVSLGLGNAQPNPRALSSLCHLVERLEPVLVSEHLCWTAHEDQHFNHLLPLPFTQETENRLVRNIQQVQNRLRRPLLIKPIAAYLRYREDEMTEIELIHRLVERTGCRILLDLTNLYVNARNHGENPLSFLEHLDSSKVEEIHIAGCHQNHFPGGSLWIDSHDSPVPQEVWELFEAMLAGMGMRPTLLERDTAFPPLENLVAEISIARQRMA